MGLIRQHRTTGSSTPTEKRSASGFRPVGRARTRFCPLHSADRREHPLIAVTFSPTGPPLFREADRAISLIDRVAGCFVAGCFVAGCFRDGRDPARVVLTCPPISHHGFLESCRWLPRRGLWCDGATARGTRVWRAVVAARNALKGDYTRSGQNPASRFAGASSRASLEPAEP